MKIFVRFTLSIGTAAALLGGCSGSQPGTLPQASMLAAPASSGNYKVIYSFSGSPDGNWPTKGFIGVNGMLYGTTAFGGVGGSGCSGSRSGCGTVFSITPTGTETVLYSFKGGSGDGANPQAGLVNVKGKFYGTTAAGGYHCNPYAYYFYCGTVFSVTANGAEKLLHRFGEQPDGADPVAPLIEVKGALYGTTWGGGAYSCRYNSGCGTVFSITTHGAEKVLHSFGYNEGAHPLAGLIDVAGKLYGTTTEGGTKCQGYGGCGTVFSITTSGAAKALHSFGRGSGQVPLAGLLDVKGTLYGTTEYGGRHQCSGGCGLVFSITRRGTEKVLYGFAGGSDGAHPNAGGLINVNGTLYGTTSGGGSRTCACGAVFSISMTGTEKVLYSFAGPPDGSDPLAGLVHVNGTLYGTTASGGKHNDGTVFALTP